VWVLVQVTDSVRPADAYVMSAPSLAGAGTVAAEEGTAVPSQEVEHQGTAGVQEVDEVSRARHRRASRLRLAVLMRRGRVGSAT
jgi:hypothetical protein